MSSDGECSEPTSLTELPEEFEPMIEASPIQQMEVSVQSQMEGGHPDEEMDSEPPEEEQLYSWDQDIYQANMDMEPLPVDEHAANTEPNIQAHQNHLGIGASQDSGGQMTTNLNQNLWRPEELRAINRREALNRARNISVWTLMSHSVIDLSPERDTDTEPDIDQIVDDIQYRNYRDRILENLDLDHDPEIINY